MTLTTTSMGGESNGYTLLHLLTEARDTGPAVQHFVCRDCMELVAGDAGSICVHECPACRRTTGANDDEETS